MAASVKEMIKDYPCSKVWLGSDGYIYKWQPKFLTDNEIWCITELYPSGIVPYAEQYDLETIKMEFIKDEPPTDIKLLQHNAGEVLVTLSQYGIRHGDLTRPNVLIRNNGPIILDFSESRLLQDPRPDKRPEHDSFWLTRTIQDIINENA